MHKILHECEDIYITSVIFLHFITEMDQNYYESTV